MSKLKNRCENCKFWKHAEFPNDEVDVDFDIGIFVRFAPTLAMAEGWE